MFETGDRVETPFWVGRVIIDQGDAVLVAREGDGIICGFVPELVHAFRIYPVGEIVYFKGAANSNRAHIQGYGEIKQRMPVNGGRYGYGIQLDDGSALWAATSEFRTLGALTGDYPAWDDLSEQPQ